MDEGEENSNSVFLDNLLCAQGQRYILGILEGKL